MTTDSNAPAIAAASDAGSHRFCRNCEEPLLGPHCYACGQPVSGLMRPLGNLFGDLMDTVFNIDARVVRTLWPLFSRPGFLSREFFAGRQVRYVTPVRLFFFLCIFAFFVARFVIADGSAVKFDINDSRAGEIGAAMTESDVIVRRDAALKRLQEPTTTSRARTRISTAINSTADRRLQDLRQAAVSGLPPPPPMQDGLRVNGKPWDARANPLHIPGAPGLLDAWVNHQYGRANQNIQRLKSDPNRYLDAFVGAIPTALFVLVPVFAVMLKLAYITRRRLYMEHLVVALHSHAFLSMSLLLVFGCLLIQRVVPDGGVLDDVMAWCIGLLLAWVPIYLLVMQKRVYAESWLITVAKYSVLGVFYLIFLGIGISVAAVASLVWL